MSRRLLIDAGNTRLKWVVVDGGRWQTRGHCDYTEWSALAEQMTGGTRCYIASVTRNAHEQQLAALMESAGVAASWLSAGAGFAELKNTYLNPQQLGVDRWMGLIGARRRTHDSVLVVSVGTAMTVDALSSEGVFLGGVIVPGAGLMRQALRQGTARVDAAAGHWQAFPRCTADAVASGIVAALCGAIQQQHARLAEASGRTPRCLLTGGDAGLVLPYLNISAEQVPELVLEGLDCVAGEGEKR